MKIYTPQLSRDVARDVIKLYLKLFLVEKKIIIIM